MKRIGIDARLYFQTGIGTYLRNFLYYLDERSDLNWEIVVYLFKDDFERVRFKNKFFLKKKIFDRWHSFSEQIRFLSILNNDHLDLIHFPYFSFPFFYRRPFVCTVHDLTPLFFKTGRASASVNLFNYYLKSFGLKILLKRQIRDSLIVFTPSKTVKNQIVYLFGKNLSSKITVVSEGINKELIEEKENKQLRNIFGNDFFIYVGNYYPHKNVERLIKAFSQINCREKLILIGPNDFFSKRLAILINNLNQNQRIIFYHRPKPADLVFFYKNAQALIHPSLSEGFGLPLIEATYFNCPIIASNIPIFKEILGKNYLSFNPYQEFDIKDKIEWFIKTHPKFDNHKIIKKYSFKRMTEKMITEYKKFI